MSFTGIPTSINQREVETRSNPTPPTLSFSGTREEVELTERIKSISKSRPLDISKSKDGDYFGGIAYVRKTIQRVSDTNSQEINVEFHLVDTKGNSFQVLKYNPDNPLELMKTQSKTVMVEGTAKDFKGKIYYRLNTIVLFDEQYPLSYFINSLDSLKIGEKVNELLQQMSTMGVYRVIIDPINLLNYIEFLKTRPVKGVIGNAIVQMVTAMRLVDFMGVEGTKAEITKFIIATKFIHEYYYGEFTERKVIPIVMYQSIENSSLGQNQKWEMIDTLSKEKTSYSELANSVWNTAYQAI